MIHFYGCFKSNTPGTILCLCSLNNYFCFSSWYRYFLSYLGISNNLITILLCALLGSYIRFPHALFLVNLIIFKFGFCRMWFLVKHKFCFNRNACCLEKNNKFIMIIIYVSWAELYIYLAIKCYWCLMLLFFLMGNSFVCMGILDSELI